MKTARDNAEKIKEISGANPQKCMKCGKCSATCPAFNEMWKMFCYLPIFQ